MNLPDLERLLALAKSGARICTPGPEEWSGGMSAPRATWQAEYDIDLGAIVARVRELEGMVKAGAYWEERAQEHRIRVRELEEALGEALNEWNRRTINGDRIAALRSLLAPGERGE